MIQPSDPRLIANIKHLKGLIQAQGVEQWLKEMADEPTVEALIYLCKFGFFTGILTRAQIADMLQVERKALKPLVKSWYDDHLAKGCGTC